MTATALANGSFPVTPKDKVCIIGSGNWGSAIAKIIGNNTPQLPFCDDHVNMWVHEEEIGREKLSHIINHTHENVKYLPGITLPENVAAVPDLRQACDQATLLIFVVPHQFLPPVLPVVRDCVEDGAARGISLIKGLEYDPRTHNPIQISHMIEQNMRRGFKCGALMGANLAKEVARGDFCESTLACDFGKRFNEATRLVFAAPNFSVRHCKDVAAVEVCGALKNVVALGAGFVDGLGLGGNTKAALLRVGLLEIMDFAQRFFVDVKPETFWESCGVADLIATCYGGRNRKCAEAFSRQSTAHQSPDDCARLWDSIEQELLNGQKLQGILTTKELYEVLSGHYLLDDFPLFSMIHDIAFQGRPVADIATSIRVPLHRVYEPPPTCIKM